MMRQPAASALPDGVVEHHSVNHSQKEFCRRIQKVHNTDRGLTFKEQVQEHDVHTYNIIQLKFKLSLDFPSSVGNFYKML